MGKKAHIGAKHQQRKRAKNPIFQAADFLLFFVFLFTILQRLLECNNKKNEWKQQKKVRKRTKESLKTENFARAPKTPMRQREFLCATDNLKIAKIAQNRHIWEYCDPIFVILPQFTTKGAAIGTRCEYLIINDVSKCY